MFEPANALERSLVQAAQDPSHRPQFYRDLLGSDIFLISAGEPLDAPDGVLQKGERLRIEAWQYNDENWLPIFSSLPRLQSAISAESNYLRLNARDFFEMTRGANVVLNPGQDYGKEFPRSEVQTLLDESLLRATGGYTVETETEVLLGQPAIYPTELVQALSRLFARHRNVSAAYLAHIANPSRGENPHTLIGVTADGDCQQVIGEAGFVASQIVPGEEPVDFLLMTDDSDVCKYLVNETKPFYRRSWLRRLFR